MARTMDSADNSMAIDMNRQHVSMSMISQARMQVPNVGLNYTPSLSDESDEWHISTTEIQELRRQTLNNGFSNVKIAPLQQRGRQNVDYRWNVNMDRRQEVRNRMMEIVR